MKKEFHPIIFIKRNSGLIFFSVITVAGICSGAVCAGATENSFRLSLFDILCALSEISGAKGTFALFSVLALYALMLFAAVFLNGTSLAGIPFICITAALHGFIHGFISAVICIIFGGTGLLSLCLCVSPLVIPLSVCLILYERTAVGFSYSLVALGGRGQRARAEFPEIAGFYKRGFVLFLPCLAGAFPTAWLIPISLRMMMS